MKRVLSIGQCAMDHASIRREIEGHFHAEVIPAHNSNEALDALRSTAFDLVLINRVLDADGSDGLSIIEQMKVDPALASVPVMLVTNYPEYQVRAVEVGAEPGFGKMQLGTLEARQRLEPFLS